MSALATRKDGCVRTRLSDAMGTIKPAGATSIQKRQFWIFTSFWTNPPA